MEWGQSVQYLQMLPWEMVQNTFTPPAEAWVTTLKIIMATYVEFSVQEGTIQQRGGEPGPTLLISDLRQIMTQGDK